MLNIQSCNISLYQQDTVVVRPEACVYCLSSVSGFNSHRLSFGNQNIMYPVMWDSHSNEYVIVLMCYLLSSILSICGQVPPRPKS